MRESNKLPQEVSIRGGDLPAVKRLLDQGSKR